MFLTHHKPFRHLPNFASMHNQFRRLMEDDFFKPFVSKNNDDFRTGDYPVTDIIETKDDYVLKLEVPGLKKDDIKVEITENTLSVSGERKQDSEINEEDYHRIEGFSGSFNRSFTLPGETDTGKIKASMKNGILELRIAKAEEKKAKSISIDVN